MKRFLHTGLFLVFVLSVFSQISITTNWELSDSLSTLPLTIGTGNGARGMAFGNLGSGERVFVVSRSSDTGNKVQVYNAADGAYVSALDMTGVTGGTFIMNDAGMTDDGKLLMGNLGNPLKIYKWDSESGVPVKVIEWATTSSRRYGDKITVTGNYNDGTARIYILPNASLTGYKLQYFEMEQVAGIWQFKQTPTEMNTSLSIAGYPGVGLRTDGGFYLKAGGGKLTQYDNSGVAVGVEAPTTIVPVGTSTVRYIKTLGGYDYLAYVRYYGNSTAAANAKTAANRIDIIKVPVATGLADVQFVASTPSLGKNPNVNGAAGLVVRNMPDNSVEMYVLNTNNGLAKYTVNGLFTTGVNNNTSDQLQLIRSGNELVISGVELRSFELYNVAGQKIRTVANANRITVDGLKGVYVIKVYLSDNTQLISKVLL